MTISPTASAIKAAASLRSRMLLASAGAAMLLAAVPAQAATTPSLNQYRNLVDCLDGSTTENCSPSAVAPGARSLSLPVTDTAPGPTGDSSPPDEEPCTSCT